MWGSVPDAMTKEKDNCIFTLLNFQFYIEKKFMLFFIVYNKKIEKILRM
jgi:hypothetical protein